MYGYIVPDLKDLSLLGYANIQAHYCSLCFALKKEFVNIARLTTNYDFAFLSAFLHAYTGETQQFKTGRCAMSPFRKKDFFAYTPLLKRIAHANILFAYIKALDAKQDRDGVKHRLARAHLKQAYKKAAAKEPEINNLLLDEYEKQKTLEKENCSDYIEISRPSALILEGLIRILLTSYKRIKTSKEEDEAVFKIFNNLGKFIYFCDALDDLDKDKRTGAFNIIAKNFNFVRGAKQFKRLNKEKLLPLLTGPINEININFKKIEGMLKSALAENVFSLGLNLTMERVLGR